MDDDATAFALFSRDDSNFIELAKVVNYLDIPSDDWEIANYKVALFIHSSWPESQTLVLRENDTRIGFLFSLEALASEESILKRKNNTTRLALSHYKSFVWDNKSLEYDQPKLNKGLQSESQSFFRQIRS
ncbi:hypothetical protein [Tunturiibacter gelidiferens]|uniref:hypothetical protein n=1 Tax=Tunturiibacter gelidiferens TaxID=3069689 RepID=UPI003D9BF35F